VILICIDTLRADHLSAYGYEHATSPAIDALAADALLFENAFSHASDTRLSMAALLSGFLPHETAVMKLGAPSPDEDLLPSALRRHGYKTLAVVSNYVLRASRGWSTGFDTFDDRMDEHEAVRPLPERTAPHTTDRAVQLLREHRDERFFLWVHYQDPHGPYTPPPEHDIFHDAERAPRQVPSSGSLSGRGGIPTYQALGDDDDWGAYVSRYDGEIHFADRHVGRLLDELRRLGLYGESLIILTSDHGEGMGEHDYFFAHGEELRAPLLRVPLIVKHGRRLRGRRTDPAQHLDLAPTIRAVVGLPPDVRHRGRDLRRPVAGQVERFAQMNSSVAPEPVKLALARGGYQLVHTPEPPGDELFRLDEDPLALQDLSRHGEHRSRVERLRARLLEIRAEDRLTLPSPEELPELTPEELEKLRALGYLK
jgi:arylsulfatase A-like enzyme